MQPVYHQPTISLVYVRWDLPEHCVKQSMIRVIPNLVLTMGPALLSMGVTLSVIARQVFTARSVSSLTIVLITCAQMMPLVLIT